MLEETPQDYSLSLHNLENKATRPAPRQGCRTARYGSVQVMLYLLLCLTEYGESTLPSRLPSGSNDTGRSAAGQGLMEAA